MTFYLSGDGLAAGGKSMAGIVEALRGAGRVVQLHSFRGMNAAIRAQLQKARSAFLLYRFCTGSVLDLECSNRLAESTSAAFRDVS
jgi:hypothetical protein